MAGSNGCWRRARGPIPRTPTAGNDEAVFDPFPTPPRLRRRRWWPRLRRPRLPLFWCRHRSPPVGTSRGQRSAEYQMDPQTSFPRYVQPHPTSAVPEWDPDAATHQCGGGVATNVRARVCGGRGTGVKPSFWMPVAGGFLAARISTTSTWRFGSFFGGGGRGEGYTPPTAQVVIIAGTHTNNFYSGHPGPARDRHPLTQTQPTNRTDQQLNPSSNLQQPQPGMAQASGPHWVQPPGVTPRPPANRNSVVAVVVSNRRRPAPSWPGATAPPSSFNPATFTEGGID